MAFDPNTEDYQRLGLRFVSSLEARGVTGNPVAFAEFGFKYASDRDSLPQTDEDRAFHLVALATNLIDYELPFSDDTRARDLIDRGHALLDEALSLDPKCHDARRMREVSLISSFDGLYDYLASGADEVRADCEAKATALAREGGPADRVKLAQHIAMRPYYRWLAVQAERALICGRNRQTIDICRKLFELDPDDMADARFTAALAYAKLEDRIGLDELATRFSASGDNAWFTLSRMALDFKLGILDDARAQLKTLLSRHPHAVATLTLQRELPDGVFSRLAVPRNSEDELVLAVSEGTVLLQEGRDRDGRGALGKWVLDATTELEPQEAAAALEEARRIEQEWQRYYEGRSGNPSDPNAGPDGPVDPSDAPANDEGGDN